MAPHGRGMLLGRDAELEQLGSFLYRVRGGVSDALVILGDPGAGKTALLDHLVTTANALGGFTVLQARCLEAESEISYSGLADVTRPVRRLIDGLPCVQARTLQAALALGPSAAPGPGAGDRRLAVAIATLNLLAAAAETGPVVVTVDDAHWLDSASAEALAFTARRLGTEGVGMVFTLRRAEPWPAHFGALPAIDLQGIDAGAAAALVTRVRERPVPAEVMMRLWAATGGNPLALTSLVATLDEAQLLGNAQIPDPLPVGAAIRHGFARRMAGLPPACRDALLVVAAADAPQQDAVAAALGESGLSVADLEPAESRGLISIGPEGDLVFEHPLLRSAVYHDASPSSRRAAHAALARALTAAPERRVWHLALAAAGPDESVAADLADAARQAGHRGGYGAAARAFELAARLSPSADCRAARLFEAAQAAALVGQATRMNDLLDAGLAAGPDAVLRARMQNLRGRVDSFWASPLRAGRLLLAEAGRVEGVDAALAAQMRVEAAAAIGLAGRVQEDLTAAVGAYRTATALGDDDLSARAGLLLGIVRILAGDPQRGRPLLEASVARLPGQPLSADSALDLFFYVPAAAQALSWVGELDRAASLVAGFRERSRDALLPGQFSWFDALGMSSEIELRRGRLAAAHAAAAESVQLGAGTSAGTQYAFALARLGAAAAAMGLAEECRASVAGALAASAEADLWNVPVAAHAALGLLALGDGDPGEAARALDLAEHAAERSGLGHPGVVPYGGDRVEALARAGRRRDAEHALGRLEAQARISQGTWELGVTARCHGLLAPPEAADDHFEQALALLEPVSAFEAARTRLCWGQSLRRRRQRGQARKLFDQALETFARLGAVTWARQAERELEASGASVHRTAPAPASQLTPREFQICALVAQGATNREVAAKLFLSPKTIEAHLGHIFTKLCVRSRTELTRLIIQNGLA